MCDYNIRLNIPSGRSVQDYRAYLLCNIIFSGDYEEFRVSDVIRWLAEYDVRMTADEVRRELVTFVQQGDLNPYIDCYTVAKSARLFRSA